MKVEKLLFVHIPKTAGLSLHSALVDYFGESNSIRFGDSSSFQKFHKLSDNELKEFNYITGHLRLNGFRSRGIDYPAITIVRNPIDRLLSMYKYLNQSDHPDHVNLKFSNIHNFIQYILKNQGNDNCQCIFIGNDRKHTKSIEVINNDLIYVAPLEYFDDVIKTWGQLLAKQLKINNRNKSNKTSKDTEDRLVIQKELEKYWEEDMKLYEFVKKNYVDLKRNFIEQLNAKTSIKNQKIGN
ncbi:MAG: sulfotransferase family 2 domain-containing protein [Gomphosphaeria aponina SAG 52.96 = DSM 107014]|uniref:Sulfotransferase family 2 domain-containing protein n=1 Tax=Gomphosphaeria aponina SAG 52.96 = DSM 107014 TaxID=1521640 RepID=A0A941GV55_9CHRO|nr:sulfotransferase family 2 domain-containing protein [Gomphosphaeria aponina SAG 52.96 = DSM 107014]